MPINRYLNQTVTIKSRTGYDAYGKPTVSSASTIEARIQEKTNSLVDDNGQEFLTDAELWVKPAQTIAVDDVITFDGNAYKVVRVDTKRTFTGTIDHKKVYLVKTSE